VPDGGIAGQWRGADKKRLIDAVSISR